jgi:hypothetical protein
MNNSDFERLLESVRQMNAINAGTMLPSRVFIYKEGVIMERNLNPNKKFVRGDHAYPVLHETEDQVQVETWMPFADGTDHKLLCWWFKSDGYFIDEGAE